MAKQLIVICFLPFLLAGVSADILASGQTTLLTQAVPLKTDVLTQSAVSTNVLGIVSDFASNPTALTSGVTGYLTGLITPHLDLFNQLFDTLISTLSPAISCVLQLPGQLLQAITSVATSFVGCVTPIATAASSLLSQVLNVKLATNAIDLVKSLADVLGCVLTSLLNPGGLVGCVLDLVNSVLNTLVGLLQTILGLLVQVLSTVLTAATCLLSAATNVLGTATNLVLGLVTCAAGAGTSIVPPPLPIVATDHSKIINEAFGKINATVPTQKEFDRIAALFNATALNVTNLLPNYTVAYITTGVTKVSRSYYLYLSTYAKIYLSKGDTVTASCATNATNAIDAYVNQTVTQIANQIASIGTRVGTLKQTVIVLEQQKYDLVVNQGYAAVTKCDTTFATDSQVQTCADNAVSNFKTSLNNELVQVNAANDEVSTLQYQPQQLVASGLVSVGNFATAAYQQAKVCSSNKL